MAKCYKCGKQEVSEEYARCEPCEISHKELCKELDARPKQHIKPIKEELMAIKEVKQGINVTTFIDRNDAANMNIPFVPTA